MLSRQARIGRRAAEPAARPLSRVAAAFLALVASVALAACGEAEPEADTGPASSLTVTLDRDGPDGAKEAESVEVFCPGAAGCSVVAKLTARDFEPVAPDTACTEIFGGPETASVEGELDGEEVEAELSRANGCEIERFGSFLPLLRVLFPDYEPGSSLGP